MPPIRPGNNRTSPETRDDLGYYNADNNPERKESHAHNHQPFYNSLPKRKASLPVCMEGVSGDSFARHNNVKQSYTINHAELTEHYNYANNNNTGSLKRLQRDRYDDHNYNTSGYQSEVVEDYGSR